MEASLYVGVFSNDVLDSSAYHTAAISSVAVLMIGIAIGIGFIVAVQKKYNKGVF